MTLSTPLSACNPHLRGREVVETKATLVELVPPHEAGKYNPPMQDWLVLPVGDECPDCGIDASWGTRNPAGYFPVRFCKGCSKEFRQEVDAYLMLGIAEALAGQPKRFWRGDVPSVSTGEPKQ